MADERDVKTVTVTSCSSAFTGKRAGVEFTIYEVEATREDGAKIDVPLRSFEELPLETVTVRVQRYSSATHGVSYTLSRVDRGKSTRDRVAAVEQWLHDLAERVRKLEA